MHVFLLGLMLIGTPGKTWEIVVIDVATKEAKTYRITDAFRFEAGAFECFLKPAEVKPFQDALVQTAMLMCSAIDSVSKNTYSIALQPRNCAWSYASERMADLTADFDGTLKTVVARTENKKEMQVAIETKCLK